jgi:succinate-semialdehyde dehydrogenase/glutarate-semialdehyde dehydrogenase
MKIDEVEKIIKLVNKSFESWKVTGFIERLKLMLNAANVLRTKKEELSKLMTDEMGKPIAQSRAEIEKCAWVCEYYAENSEKFLRDEIIETDAAKSFVTYQPLGIVLAVMPWNFPFWQVFRFLAPALMAGNGALLKHAPNVTGCALAIESLVKEAGFPAGLFSTLIISTERVEAVLDNDCIKAVTLTGSTRAGKAVATLSASRLKKSVLELGGSDPYVILSDASLASAVDTCTQSRLMNSGQSCIAAKRFIVVSEVYEEFLDQMKVAFEHITMGDPKDDTTDMGPLARTDLRDALHEQVAKSIKAGAQCVLGGEIPDKPGAYYPPTILSEVIPGMPAFDEELFGPVAAVIRASDEYEAIALANQTKFGLGGAVFTSNLERGREIAEELIESGSCFVNDFVRSDPRLPFGGIKQSGYGRELGVYGIREFVNVKTISVSQA